MIVSERTRRLTSGQRRTTQCALVLAIALPLAALSGCAMDVTSADRATVDADLRERTGFRLGIGGDGPAQYAMGILASSEPLAEEAAVNIALLNNAAFQEQLADLGLTRADVIQAGLITNPDAQVLFPVGPKQLEATITAPLEAFWLRDRRIESAQLAADRTAARLTQAGLDLIRDVRLAYAELVLARERQTMFEEAAKLRTRMSEIAKARVEAGEAIPLDAVSARVDLLRAQQDAASLAFDAAVALERLKAVIGAGAFRNAIHVKASPDFTDAGWDIEALVKEALAHRADLKAAQLAVAAATNRVKLAQLEWFGVAFIADANEKGSKGFEAGPGIKFTLPIFNQNQGNIARACAELDRSVLQQRTVEHRIILEVREAHTKFKQAHTGLQAWRERLLPALEEAVTLAEKAYKAGETPLVQVLDTHRQVLDARIHGAQTATDLRRAHTELERSVGRRLDMSAGSNRGAQTP